MAWKGPGVRDHCGSRPKDPATQGDVPCPGPPALPACFWQPRVAAKARLRAEEAAGQRREALFTQSPVTPATCPGSGRGRGQSWPGLLATPSSQDSLAFIPQFVGQEQGQRLECASVASLRFPYCLASLAACGRELSGSTLCIRGGKCTGTTDRMDSRTDSRRVGEDVSLLQDF